MVPGRAASVALGQVCCLPEGCPASSPRARRCQGALHLQHGCPQGGLQACGETSPFLLASGNLTSSHLQPCPPAAAHALQPGQLLDTQANPATHHTTSGFPDAMLQMFPLCLVKPAAAWDPQHVDMRKGTQPLFLMLARSQLRQDTAHPLLAYTKLVNIPMCCLPL